MQPLHRVVQLATVLASFTALSFGSAIVSGFNSTTDGRNDDGTYTTGGCSNPADGGTCAGTPVSIGFNVDFYGTTYNSLYVNTNGNVSFDAPFPFVQGLLQSGLSSAQDDIIAPFLADVDTRGVGTVSFGDGTFDGYKAFGVNWTDVGYYDKETDKRDTFQLLLVDRPDQGAGDFEIVFNYGRIHWETGDGDYGTDGLGGYSAIAGFVNGTSDNPTVVELPGSGVPGSFITGGLDSLCNNSLNSNVDGRYIFDIVNSPVATPEPGTFGLLLGALGVLIYRHRQVSRRSSERK